MLEFVVDGGLWGFGGFGVRKLKSVTLIKSCDGILSNKGVLRDFLGSERKRLKF